MPEVDRLDYSVLLTTHVLDYALSAFNETLSAGPCFSFEANALKYGV